MIPVECWLPSFQHVGQIHRRRAGNLLLLFCRTHEYIYNVSGDVVGLAGFSILRLLLLLLVVTSYYILLFLHLLQNRRGGRTHTAHAPDFSHVANVRILFGLLLDLLQLSKIPFFLPLVKKRLLA